MDQPTQSDLHSLLASIEEVQSKILQTRGPSDEIKKGWAAELEPLKAPVFFLFELLGYGTVRELSENGIGKVWMASFRSSPGEYLEECLSLLRDYKVPISEYDGGAGLRQTLINFYSDMVELYEGG